MRLNQLVCTGAGDSYPGGAITTFVGDNKVSSDWSVDREAHSDWCREGARVRASATRHTFNPWLWGVESNVQPGTLVTRTL